MDYKFRDGDNEASWEELAEKSRNPQIHDFLTNFQATTRPKTSVASASSNAVRNNESISVT